MLVLMQQSRSQQTPCSVYLPAHCATGLTPHASVLCVRNGHTGWLEEMQRGSDCRNALPIQPDPQRKTNWPNVVTTSCSFFFSSSFSCLLLNLKVVSRPNIHVTLSASLHTHCHTFLQKFDIYNTVW